MGLIRVGDRKAGIGTTQGAAQKGIFFQQGDQDWLAGNPAVDSSGSYDRFNDTADVRVLSPGTLLGKITTGGLYRPSILGTLTTSIHASAATALTVGAAAAAAINAVNPAPASLFLIAPPNDTGTVTTLTTSLTGIDTTTGVLTVSALTAAAAIGSIVASNDGSHLPRGVLDQYLTLRDEAGNDLDPPVMRLAIRGFLKTAQINHYSNLATSVKTWVRQQLSDPSIGSDFQFDDVL